MQVNVIDGLFQRESVPVLDAALAFAEQRHKVITNNIANVDTPAYRRQSLPEGEFNKVLKRAIRERETSHPSRFAMRGSFDIDVEQRGTYPVARRIYGQDHGPERHDENNVVIEREMVDLAKNTLFIETLQRSLKKKYTMLRTAISERVM